MSDAPPTRLKLADVPTYLQQHHDLEISRQTVYNWAKKGRKGHTLRTATFGLQQATTPQWIEEFLEAIR
jgi:hypothetical protein